jgi:hypothetical protein
MLSVYLFPYTLVGTDWTIDLSYISTHFINTIISYSITQLLGYATIQYHSNSKVTLLISVYIFHLTDVLVQTLLIPIILIVLIHSLDG